MARADKPRCVNHNRREATSNLLGVGLCQPCARAALVAALALDAEEAPPPAEDTTALPHGRVDGQQPLVAAGPQTDPWTPDVTEPVTEPVE